MARGRGGAAVGRQEFSGRVAEAEFVVFMPSLRYRTIHGARPAGHRQRKTSSRRHEASRRSAASKSPEHDIHATNGMAVMAHAILLSRSALDG